MAEKDLYEDLCRYYEFMMGPLPKRDQFKRTLQETVTPEELRIFFLLPFSGSISRAKLRRKGGIPPEQLDAHLERLATQGLIMMYGPQEDPLCERTNPVYMTEQQVRRPEDTPRRTFYAQFFNAILSGEFVPAAPTRTPYYRVLPAEAALTAASRTVKVDAPIPDPRQVLPIDVVSEMIKRNAGLIGLVECYCRKARRIVGQGCDHPLDTCLVFGKAAEALIGYGTGRRIDVDEALAIVQRAEEARLVHNVDNCEDKIGSICNCCACCSVLLTSWQRGLTNADAPSRYVVDYAAERCTLCEACLKRCPTAARQVSDAGKLTVDPAVCLGCGLCVTACPQGANRMVLRQKQARLAKTSAGLYGKIAREAMVGLVKNKLLGRG